jgi:hypothetical protein
MIVILFATFFLIGLVGAIVVFPRKRPAAIRRLPNLTLLALPPIVALAWGRMFRVEPGTYNPQLPVWITGFLGVLILVSLALPVAISPSMKGARAFTAFVGLSMAAATAATCFLAAMQVTGAWI